MERIDFQTKMETSEEDPIIPNSWRIPLCLLKRLDSIDGDWSMTPNLGLHSFPEMLLEPILEPMKENKIHVWQNWNSFPIIDTNHYPGKHEPPPSSKLVAGALKVRHTKVGLDRLTYWEQLTRMATSYQTDIMMHYTSLFSLIIIKPSKQTSFLPKIHLDEFKKMPLFVEKTQKKRSSELDYLRFRF